MGLDAKPLPLMLFSRHTWYRLSIAFRVPPQLDTKKAAA
jgi:hypothetical protein